MSDLTLRCERKHLVMLPWLNACVFSPLTEVHANLPKATSHGQNPVSPVNDTSPDRQVMGALWRNLLECNKGGVRVDHTSGHNLSNGNIGAA